MSKPSDRPPAPPDKTAGNTGKRFLPGQSGNPAGRPRGSRNRSTVLAQDLLDGEADAVIQKCIQMAKKGNPVALRLVVDRLIPARQKGSIVTFELPSLRNAGDIVSAAAAIIEAAAAGEISLAEAKDFMFLLDCQRSAIETHEISVRLEVLQSLVDRQQQEDSERE